MVDGLKGSRHFAPGSISFIAMKLSRPSHAPLRLPQLLGIYADPTQQTGELEERITAVEIALPPQDSETNSPVASLQQSKQLGTKNLVSANAVINSDEPSDFLLFSKSRFAYSKVRSCPYVICWKLVRLNGLKNQGLENTIVTCS